MQDKEKADEVFEMCIKYLLNVRDDIEIEELKEKIRNADDETINYIGDNLLEITIEELKEILNLK